MRDTENEKTSLPILNLKEKHEKIKTYTNEAQTVPKDENLKSNSNKNNNGFVSSYRQALPKRDLFQKVIRSPRPVDISSSKI